jgi:hypothetical protein
MTLPRRFAVLIGLVVASALIAAQAPDPRLTIADVEKVSGLSGIKQVANGSMTGAGGDLNFVGPEGRLLLMVKFVDARFYEGVRKSTTIFHAAVPGLGDDAFDAPPGSTQYVLYVKKGATAISVTSYLSSTRPYGPRLTLDQLKALARIILPRL